MPPARTSASSCGARCLQKRYTFENPYKGAPGAIRGRFVCAPIDRVCYTVHRLLEFTDLRQRFLLSDCRGWPGEPAPAKETHVKRLLALVALLLLSGCVAPAPHPFVSPLTTTFDSPLPPPAQQTYIPMLSVAINPKRGVSLACGADDMPRLAREVNDLRVAWVWNWSTQPPTFPDIESIPCVWDASYIGQPLGGNSEWVIGPNECDQWDQCNTSPEKIAVAWRQLEAAYPDRKLTSPQVVRWDKRWLEQWYAAYVVLYGEPPKMDAVAIHTYWGNDITAYKEQVIYYVDLAQRWGVPEVWVTEFAIAPVLDRTLRETVADTAAYVAWLDAQPTVTRYAPWTNRVECMSNIAPDGIFDTPLFGANGGMTQLGAMYRDAGRAD